MYEIKVGDRITVLRKPEAWASHFANNNPRDEISYPHEFLVTRTDWTESYGALEMKSLLNGICYGFSFDALKGIFGILKNPEERKPRFKVGDSVKHREHGDVRLYVTMVHEYNLERGYYYRLATVNIPEQTGYDGYDNNLELYSERLGRGGCERLKTINEVPNASQNNGGENKMNLLSKFKDIVMGEPKKTLIKYGIIDREDNLTSEGKELFINFLFERSQEEFVKEVVTALVKEDKKKD